MERYSLPKDTAYYLSHEEEYEDLLAKEGENDPNNYHFECQYCGTEDSEDHHCCECDTEISARKCNDNLGLCDWCVRMLKV